MKDIKKRTFYILGVIKEKNSRGNEVVNAVKIYDFENDEAWLESLNSLKERMISGEKVNGAELKNLYKIKDGDIRISNVIKLKCTGYDYRKLPVLNGSGEIIIPGKDVIIARTKEKVDEYLVINNKLEKRILTKDEVIQEDLCGNYEKVAFLKEDKLA